ncbi:hypothetical protein [Anaeroselena agilis]|uniref:Uncharacterized protein n=1 Tax=Anaeroselena agilis TaxID=3063788 RepID=A0ABU3NVE8_9FIRM|nr:hypothetical protein [Selenomonadales bacterium 4137-cl]
MLQYRRNWTIVATFAASSLGNPRRPSYHHSADRSSSVASGKPPLAANCSRQPRAQAFLNSITRSKSESRSSRACWKSALKSSSAPSSAIIILPPLPLRHPPAAIITDKRPRINATALTSRRQTAQE